MHTAVARSTRWTSTVEAMGAMALLPICDSSFACEDYNTYGAHPGSLSPPRRAHPGPGLHNSPILRSQLAQRDRLSDMFYHVWSFFRGVSGSRKIRSPQCDRSRPCLPTACAFVGRGVYTVGNTALNRPTSCAITTATRRRAWLNRPLSW